METKNDITELRSLLFDTIRGLNDKANPLELDRARAINETAQVIINSAKVEVDHAKATGAITTTGFLAHDDTPAPGKSNGYVHRIGQRHKEI